MLIKRISIYNEFQCVGAACSVNCCRGWKIPIDHDMYLKYLAEKGLLGTMLRCSIEKKMMWLLSVAHCMAVPFGDSIIYAGFKKSTEQHICLLFVFNFLDNYITLTFSVRRRSTLPVQNRQGFF